LTTTTAKVHHDRSDSLPDFALFLYDLSPTKWAVEALVTSQFSVYTDVLCNPFGDVVEFPFPSSPNATTEAASGCATPVLNLDDVDVAACCTVSGARPISSRAYVLTGYTYANGVAVVGLWGGPNGYSAAQLPWDFVMAAVWLAVVVAGAVALASRTRHQIR